MINIPTTVKKIGKFAFLNCKKLESISFCQNSELIEIEEKAFSGTIIQTINIPQNVQKVHKSAFDSCRKLKIIDLPEHLKFITLNNIIFSKFKYETKLCDHEFSYKFINSYLHTFNNYCNFNGNKPLNINKCKLSDVVLKHKKMFPDFFEYIKEINESYPEEFKNIPLIKQLSTNNNLSLVFLCGKSFIEKPGIYSFHLHGTMMPSVRDFNTGFICFDNSNKDKFIDNFEILLHYLLINNPLYKDIEELNQNNIEFTRKLKDKVGASCAIVIEPENEIDKTPGSRKKKW